MSMPYGVIIYSHPEIGHVERVPYETKEAMHRALADSLDSGFQPKDIECYVWDNADAEELWAMAAKHCERRMPVYGLTAENLDTVLGNHVAVVPV